MDAIATYNIRVGPGVYFTLREMSDMTGLTVEAWVNLLFVVMEGNSGDSLSGFRLSRTLSKVLVKVNGKCSAALLANFLESVLRQSERLVD
jgi:hypothetical protein